MELNGQLNESVARTYYVWDWVGPTPVLHAVENKETLIIPRIKPLIPGNPIHRLNTALNE